MKALFILTLFSTIITLANAKVSEVPRDLPLRMFIKKSFCELKVNKAFIFGKSEVFAKQGSFMFIVRGEGKDFVRRLAVGRKVEITSINRHYINTDDNNIARACIGQYASENSCMEFGDMTIADIEERSENSVSVVCRDADMTDI